MACYINVTLTSSENELFKNDFFLKTEIDKRPLSNTFFQSATSFGLVTQMCYFRNLFMIQRFADNIIFEIQVSMGYTFI